MGPAAGGCVGMNPIADMVAEMLARGVPADVIVLAVKGAEQAARNSTGIPVDTMAEKRRAYDRERKREQRNSTGNPPESAEVRGQALIPKKDKTKSVSRKHPCPPDWKPNEAHYAAAEKLSISRSAVESKAEDMRIWAGSTGALKLDWDLTFHGFLKRDAPRLATPPARAAPTIGPESRSWNAWKSYFRDNGKNFQAGLMDKMAADGKPFSVESEWPPGYAAA